LEVGWTLAREHWGKGYATEAAGAAVQFAFDELGADRVQASTDVSNAAMRRVLEALGWTFEGTLRAFMPDGDGTREDYALYAVTRADWITLAG
jgi:RimJ/RimL family protein N-acetyltransferase